MAVRLSRAVAPLVLVAAAVAAGCTERLDGGATCPSLCPEEGGSIRDTTIEAITLDTSLAPFPVMGAERNMLLATRGPSGDTLQAYGIVRFDSLPTKYNRSETDTGIVVTGVTRSSIRIHIDTAASRLPDSVAIDAFDVDTTADDTSSAAVVALFRDDRRIGGTRMLAKAEIKDTLTVPIDTAAVRSKILGGGRLRIGLRARSSKSVELRLPSLEGGSATSLFIVPAGDTATIGVGQASSTPADQELIAGLLYDYTVVARGTPAPPPGLLSVGGLPGRRTYLRFAVPKRLLDSTTIVRATLLLTQRPSRGIDPGDTVSVVPQVVAATARVTDLGTAARILVPTTSFFLDTIKVIVGDSIPRRVELVGLVRSWATQDTTDVPLALVLSAAREGTRASTATFFSREAAEELRPRLRLLYVPRTPLGLP